MNILITDLHQGEGVFPVFPKGSVVQALAPCEDYPHWLACSINGIKTYIPDIYLENGKLTKDYDPTELRVKKGDRVELIDIVYEWLYVKNKDHVCGWIPAKIAISQQD